MNKDLVTENDDPITEFDYELKVPFLYAYAGNQEKALMITLKAPTVKTPYRADLKQCFFRAIPQDGKEEAKGEAGTKMFTGSDILFTISMSREVSLSSFIEYGKSLLASGVALVDGQTKLTKLLIDAMDPDELENMLGEYMVNFILASALKKLNEN